LRLLIVEDEAKLRDMITKRLVKSGYSVDACGDGIEAEDYIAAAEYDCIILDRMLPGKSGTEVLRAMRAQGKSTPVLFLTALGSVEDRVEGLDAGADDYLVKPFSYDELVARIRALMRRGTDVQDTVITAGKVSLDTASQKVTVDGKGVTLSAKEHALLEYMMRNQGRMLTRENILNHVWDFDYEGDSNLVDVYIRYLRRKLGDAANELIHTMRGRGYIFEYDPDR
jgi:DNA-binding response OmpR family regulator